MTIQEALDTIERIGKSSNSESDARRELAKVQDGVDKIDRALGKGTKKA